MGFLLRKSLTSGKPGVFWPGDCRQGDDCILQTAAERAGNGQRKHQPWKCQKHVADAHQQRIQPAAVPAANHPHGRSNGGGNGNENQRGENAGAAACNDPGKHVPPIAVGTQQMCPAGRLLCNA